jgi:hypothetical protein
MFALFAKFKAKRTQNGSKNLLHECVLERVSGFGLLIFTKNDKIVVP